MWLKAEEEKLDFELSLSRPTGSHFFQHEFRITEALRVHVHLIHHRHEEAAELAFGLAAVVGV
jgi:hypothetical protein